MTSFNFGDMEEREEYFKPEFGKRYTLVVSAAKEALSKVKQTPYLGLSFKTEDGQDAFGKEIYNTPKALYRAQEWFKALGLNTSGNVEFEPENLVGIEFTAKAVNEPWYSDEQDGSKKQHDSTKWEEPLPVKIGTQPAANPAARPAAPAKPAPAPEQESVPEDVPF